MKSQTWPIQNIKTFIFDRPSQAFYSVCTGKHSFLFLDMAILCYRGATDNY